MISRFADRMGVPLTILLLLFGAVWGLGSVRTRDDFIRELFFGTVTDSRYLGVFFALLIVFALAAAQGWLERRSSESREMRRIADEKRDLQEKLLDRPLSRTDQVLQPQDQPGE